MAEDKRTPQERAYETESKLRTAEAGLRHAGRSRIKWSVISFVLGAIGMGAAGFGYYDWTTAGGAKKMTESAVVAALTPACVAKATANQEALVAFAAEPPSSQDDYVKKVGWSVPLGATESLPGLSDACAAALRPIARKAAEAAKAAAG